MTQNYNDEKGESEPNSKVQTVKMLKNSVELMGSAQLGLIHTGDTFHIQLCLFYFSHFLKIFKNLYKDHMKILFCTLT